MTVRDSDANSNIVCTLILPFAELEINFYELDYSVVEGQSLENQISMQYRRTENEFSLTLTPLSIADSVAQFDLESFVDSNDIDEEERASPGEMVEMVYMFTALSVYP